MNAFQDFLNGLPIDHDGISCHNIHPVVVEILESIPEDVFTHANDNLSPEANQAAACLTQELLGKVCAGAQPLYPVGFDTELETMANTKFIVTPDELETIIEWVAVNATIVQKRLAEKFNT